MEVRKRAGSPYYLADFVGPDGTRQRPSTGERDKKRAVIKANELRDAMFARAKRDDDGYKSISLGEALSDYCAKMRSEGRQSAHKMETLRDKTLGLNPAMAGRYHLNAEMPLHDLRSVDIERLKLARAKEGNAPQTIGHEITLLRSASRYAPTLGNRPPKAFAWKVPKSAPKTRYLSWEEFEKVLAYLSPDRALTFTRKTGTVSKAYTPGGRQRAGRQDAQDLLVALVMTGGRWNEVASLTWDQIDSREGLATLWGAKVGKEREVPLAPAVAEMLERRRAAAAPGERFVFPGRWGGQRAYSARAIMRAMDAVGLNTPEMVERHGRATTHSLRHTYASWLRQSGAGLDEVQTMLGHTTMQMTRRYAQLGRGQTLERVRSILGGLGKAAAD